MIIVFPFSLYDLFRNVNKDSLSPQPLLCPPHSLHSSPFLCFFPSRLSPSIFSPPPLRFPLPFRFLRRKVPSLLYPFSVYVRGATSYLVSIEPLSLLPPPFVPTPFLSLFSYRISLLLTDAQFLPNHALRGCSRSCNSNLPLISLSLLEKGASLPMCAAPNKGKPRSP